MSLSWTQPICEGCYALRYGKKPARVIPVERETCCFCGRATYSGAYIRVDPSEAPFATKEE